MVLLDAHPLGLQIGAGALFLDHPQGRIIPGDDDQAVAPGHPHAVGD